MLHEYILDFSLFLFLAFFITYLCALCEHLFIMLYMNLVSTYLHNFSAKSKMWNKDNFSIKVKLASIIFPLLDWLSYQD